jgi:hypothetical protein
MANAPIPEDIQNFLDIYIPSVEQLDVLLFLHENPTQEWRANDVSRALYRQPEWVGRRLDALVRHGLVTMREGSERRYRYDPATSMLDRTVRQLAKYYNERRVTIITLIYSKPLQNT